MTGLSGVWAAVLTPVSAELQPDAAKAVGYYRSLLDDGIDGLNVLGTTGEAASFGIGQRLAFMEAIAASGLPRDRIMIGTGTTALADTVTLTRAAHELGFAAALVMPPFYFRDVTSEGIVAYFEGLAARVQRPRLLLYNFPAVSGVTFSAELVERLLKSLPGAIAGMKDSSNDAALQRALVARHRNFAVFCSSEESLYDRRSEGLAGCISGSVALWPQLAKRVWETGAETERLTQMRRNVAGAGMLQRIRAETARALGDDSWATPMLPLR